MSPSPPAADPGAAPVTARTHACRGHARPTLACRTHASRALVRRALAAIIGAVFALAAASPAVAIDVNDLLGQAPPDSESVPPTRSEYVDSLAVGRGADLGLVHFGDQVERLAGGDQARTGVPGITRPLQVGGAGAGRLSWMLDGFPIGQGVVHWDNPAWFPIRGVASFGLAGGAEALAGGSVDGRLVVVETFAGPPRPVSVVSLTGGSFGQRLAELGFARQFGPVKFHADVADFGHDGFGAIGRIDTSRGFARFDFPAFGFEARAALGIAAGSMETGGLSANDGTESTDESSLTLGLSRPAGSGRFDLRLMRETSRLEIESEDVDGFRLERDRWWLEAARNWTGTDAAWRVAAFASREGRRGVLDGDGRFYGGGISLAHERRWSDARRLAATLRLRQADPTGFEFEPAVTLELGHAGGSRWWIDASRSAGVPGLLLHIDQPLADRDRTGDILARLESLTVPERHLRLAVGAEGGTAVRLGVEVAAVRTKNRQPWLSVAPGPALGPATDGGWGGDARLLARWRPRPDLELGVAGGAGSFHAAEQPYRPRGRADGWARLRRTYFGHELDLSAEVGGHLVGPRRNPDGAGYPTLLAVDGTLTARIRTLTLFWRIENMSDLFIESDLRDPDFPVPLPGLSSRLGATLRLLD